ncbi:hypothetical protein L1987_15328 [Smallanthus sonchifolius]|uniref:Uncharacterized protein n=1 Tax=Smallanthus sonchifolius TaxID=185202 RepID=A0ACB9J7A8_9ASTR|nr:hypothetical protein L1987_15328 [Smallanthus sonchifolius]
MSFTAVVVRAGLWEVNSGDEKGALWWVVNADVGKHLGDDLDGGLYKDDVDGASFTVAVVVVNIFTVDIVGSFTLAVIIHVLQ